MTDFIFETDGKTITCSLCGNQYRTLSGALKHRDRDHSDKVAVLLVRTLGGALEHRDRDHPDRVV